MFYTSRRFVLALCTIGLAGLVTGCATTMSQNECLSADWYAVGLEDGARGQSMTQFGVHRKQCAEFNVTPNLQAYQQGRSEGLDYFCTLSNGISVGKAGRSYAGACPGEMEYNFLTGYRHGRELHRVRSDMRSNRIKLNQAEKELQSEETSDERTAELRFQLRSLEREYGRMQSRLEYLENEEQRMAGSEVRSPDLAAN